MFANRINLTVFLLRTEFQMKFLWGSKGALVPAEERHAKFEHVLTVMAEKFCGDPSAG